MFDLTIKLGDIIAVCVMVGGGYAIVAIVRDRVDALSGRMGKMEAKVEDLVDVLVNQGRQDERMTAMTNRVTTLDQRVSQLEIKLDRFADAHRAKH